MNYIEKYNVRLIDGKIIVSGYVGYTEHKSDWYGRLNRPLTSEEKANKIIFSGSLTACRMRFMKTN